MDKLRIGVIFRSDFPIIEENLEIPAAHLPEHKSLRHTLLLTAVEGPRMLALQLARYLNRVV